MVDDVLSLSLLISISGWRAGSMGDGKCSISTLLPFTTACSRVMKKVDDLF